MMDMLARCRDPHRTDIPSPSPRFYLHANTTMVIFEAMAMTGICGPYRELGKKCQSLIPS
jgi:hypothetical protein